MSLDPTIFLIEAQASNGSTVSTYYFCSGAGYTSFPTDTPANQFYEPRVDQPGLYRQSMFAVGTTGGASTGGYGEIVLLNPDGGLDYLLDLGFDGQVCVVKQGTHAMPLSAFATIITGTIEQCDPSWGKITFRLKDNTTLLDVPIQPTRYGGTNVLPAGIDGTADIQGKPLPRLFGICNNVTPICVNTFQLIYQVNNGAVNSFTNIYDMGMPLTPGVDRANNAALQANTPASSCYDTCLAEGLFKLGTIPIGQITCDVTQGAATANRTSGQIIKTLATEKLTAARVATQPIIDLDKAAPYAVGIYIDSDTTYKAVLDLIAQSVGAWWGFDNLGIFWAKQLQAPAAAQAIMSLTTNEILTIDRTATGDGDKGVPVWRVSSDYAKNWTVQTNLASTVAADRAKLLAQEYVRTKAEDATVKSLHAMAPEIVNTTLLAVKADADTESARLLAMRKVRRDRLQVKVSQLSIQYPDGGYWDDEAISEMPTARRGASAVVYGNWLYVAGGEIVSGTPITSVIRLDLSNPTSAWDDVGVTDLPVARSNFYACVYNNWLYVIGGSISGSFTASVIRLDLSNPTGAWDDVGVTDLPAARQRHAGGLYGSLVYIIGGTAPFATASVIRLDLSTPTGAWDDAGVTDLPAARDLPSAIVYNNWLYVVGGFFSGTPTATVMRLNLSAPSGAWDDAGVTDLPIINSSIALVIYNGFLYALGGYSTSYTNKVYMLNLSAPAGAWDDVSVTDLPTPRQNLSAIVFNNSMYAIGGYTTVAQSNTWLYRNNANPNDVPQLTSLGRTLNIQVPRYGYISGRPMRIIGAETDNANRMTTFDLWG